MRSGCDRGCACRRTRTVRVHGPGLLVYGLLRAFLQPVPTAAPGSHLGTMLVAAGSEQRWKHRMVAIMIAIAHGMAYFTVN